MKKNIMVENELRKQKETNENLKKEIHNLKVRTENETKNPNIMKLN